MVEPVRLIRGVVDALKRAKALRQVRDEQKAAPAPAESSVDSGFLGRAAVFTQDLGNTAKIVTGVVVDSLAGAHFYKVQTDHGDSIKGCTSLGSSSNAFMGARSLSSILPGSRVWLIIHPAFEYGIIIGCEPDVSVDGRKQLPDAISLSGGAGANVDDAHKFPSIMSKGSGVIDFANWRPMDGTTVGEWGHITETGLRMFLDPFMAQLAVNEACGVFAFLFDNMLRLAGHNLQIRTAGSELEALNDQGEFIQYEGFTPYTWEHKGVLTADTVPGVDRDAQATQVDEKHYAEREPQYDDQMSFHRVIHSQGYLAQGGQRRVQLPPSVDIYRHESKPGPAVFSEDIALTGRYSLRSSKGITIAKRVPILNPKRRKRPEATEDGDFEANYKIAGQWGDEQFNPPDHLIRDELAVPAGKGQEHPHLVRAAGVLDTHAFTFNWEANHAYWYHQKDWIKIQESENAISGHYQAKIEFGALAGKQYLDVPGVARNSDGVHEVDHRYDKDIVDGGGGRYYPNESSIDLLEDGGIVIADGFGAEIRMTGGQIFLSAPGDIWMKSGRNTNIWAGQDAIVKAKNSIDITASDKDVRIKSEKNMQLLAGNNGSYGGLLLESRGSMFYEFAPKLGEDVISGGVVIKSSKAPAVILGESVYVRGGLDEESVGDITLDCNQGRGIYKTNAAYQEHFIRSGIWWWFCEGVGPSVGEITSAYEFMAKWCSIGGSCGINGHLAINGVKANKGWDLVVDGHYASTMCNPYVWCLKDESKADTERFLKEATEERQKLLIDIGVKQYESQFTNWWYAEKRPGNNQTIKDIGVSLRDAKQYLTQNFILFEDRWQQLSRLTGGTVGTWEEKKVKISATSGKETYPYPGKKPWLDGKNLYELDLRYSDAGSAGLTTKDVNASIEVGVTAVSSSPSADAKIGEPYTGTDGEPAFSFKELGDANTKILDGNYRVIIPSD